MHNLSFVYKCLQNIAPDLIKSYFIKSSDVYSIRGNGLDILIPKVRTESAKKGTFYSGAQAQAFFRVLVKRLDFFLFTYFSYLLLSFYPSTLYIVFTFF